MPDKAWPITVYAIGQRQLEAIDMVPKKRTKPSLELDDENPGTLVDHALFDPLDAGENLVMSLIEDGLDALGENIGRVILYHIETNYSLKRHQIAKRLDLFTEALRDIFGEGSLMIERLIVETISRKAGIPSHKTKIGKLPETISYLKTHWPLTASELRRTF